MEKNIKKKQKINVYSMKQILYQVLFPLFIMSICFYMLCMIQGRRPHQPAQIPKYGKLKARAKGTCTTKQLQKLGMPKMAVNDIT